jgi:hypothetical protein
MSTETWAPIWPGSRGLWLGVVIALAIVVSPIADAAVRQCSARLTSIPAVGQTEQAARKGALDDWTAKAKAAGFSHALWRSAADKRLICQKQQNLGFECLATGRACTIVQAPGIQGPRIQGPRIQGPGLQAPPRPPALQSKPAVAPEIEI